MTISGRPLLNNVMDAALFVGRELELADVVGALRQDLNVAIVGDPGSGKTSLLRTLMYRHRAGAGGVAAGGVAAGGVAAGGVGDPVDRSAGEWDFTYVRAEAVTTAAELLDRIALELLGSTAARVDAAAVPSAISQSTAPVLAAIRKHRQDQTALYRARTRPAGPTGPAGPAGSVGSATGGSAAVGASSIAGPLRAVIVLDDVAAYAGHQFFSELRDELWASGYRWLVALRPSELGVLSPPADAFFERVVSIGDLAQAEAISLIERRQLWPAGWAGQVASVVGGNPRRVLSAARDFVERPDELAGAFAATGRRDAAIGALGRPAIMLAAELQALGSASASDEALLTRLGWTRARATQVLTQLEQAGLVTSSLRKQPQGRPKKVYRLVPGT